MNKIIGLSSGAINKQVMKGNVFLILRSPPPTSISSQPHHNSTKFYWDTGLVRSRIFQLAYCNILRIATFWSAERDLGKWAGIFP